MSRQMPFSRTTFVFSLSCALGSCVDVVDDAADTAVAQQAIYQHEVRLRRIAPTVLEEGGDEIYLTASQSDGGSVNIIRPSGDPDYWRFDELVPRSMNQHVGTIIPDSLLIVNLWEQDGGPHDEIGTIDFLLDHAGVPKTFDTPTGHFLGIQSGWFKVRFTNRADYTVWFEVGQ
jgi:hypothetical protein